MHDMEATRLDCLNYIRDNIHELAKEFIEFNKTFILDEKGKIRILEKMIKEFIDDSQSFRITEDMVKTYALYYVSKLK